MSERDEAERELSELREERGAIVERANDHYLEQAAEIAALREAVRMLCSNVVQTTLLDGTMVWDLNSVIRTPAELEAMPPEVLPAIRRALEEER